MLQRPAFTEYLLNKSSDSSPAPENLLSSASSLSLVVLSSPVKLINSSLLGEDRRINHICRFYNMLFWGYAVLKYIRIM